MNMKERINLMTAAVVTSFDQELNRKPQTDQKKKAAKRKSAKKSRRQNRNRKRR